MLSHQSAPQSVRLIWTVIRNNFVRKGDTVFSNIETSQFSLAQKTYPKKLERRRPCLAILYFLHELGVSKRIRLLQLQRETRALKRSRNIIVVRWAHIGLTTVEMCKLFATYSTMSQMISSPSDSMCGISDQISHSVDFHCLSLSAGFGIGSVEFFCGRGV